MKKMSVALFTLLVGATAFAVTASASDKAKPAIPRTHVVEAQIVSVEAMAKTLTVKGDSGESTVKVDPSASSHLKDLRAGERVRLSCRDNEKGEHHAVTQSARYHTANRDPVTSTPELPSPSPQTLKWTHAAAPLRREASRRRPLSAGGAPAPSRAHPPR